MNDCIIIRGTTQSGEKFRPSSCWPDKHWSAQLIDACGGLINFNTKHIDDEVVVTLTRKSHLESEHLFEHIMWFCRLWDLDYTICKTECEKCEGHPKCLSENNC